jgi:NTE family protein
LEGRHANGSLGAQFWSRARQKLSLRAANRVRAVGTPLLEPGWLAMIRRTEVRLACLLCGVLLLAGTAPRAGAQTPADSVTAVPPDTVAAPPDSAAAPAEPASAPDSSSAPADTSATHAPAPAQPAWQLTPGFAVPPADTTVSDTAAPVEVIPNADLAPRGRPRVGLVLSGGGARGAAHIGLLQVLEEHRIAIDCIAGTSMGAVIGGLYAAGIPPARLDSIVNALDWRGAFTDRSAARRPRFTGKRDDDVVLVGRGAGIRRHRLVLPPGAVDGHRLDLLLKRLTLPAVFIRDFDQLAVPYRAVAADLLTGEEVVIDRGDLAQAMRASLCVPAAFTPRELDGRLLVDGGIVDNLPIEVARRMGADVVIVMDIAPPPKKREELNTIPAITFHLSILAGERNRRRQIATLGDSDVFLRPDLGSIGLGSFDRTADAIAIGRQAAESLLTRLEPLALSPADYQEWQSMRAARVPDDSIDVGAVNLENLTAVDDAIVTGQLDPQPPGRFDVTRLEHGIDRLYALGLYEGAWYDLERGPDGTAVKVTALPRASGLEELHGGLAVFDDYEHPGFNLALNHTRRALNKRNATAAAGIELGHDPALWARLHQPLDDDLQWFAEFEPSYVRWSVDDFENDGRKRAEYGVTQYGFALSGGRQIASWLDARAGYVRLGGNVHPRAGAAADERASDVGELYFQVHADVRDQSTFPTRGFALRGRLTAGLEGLGSNTGYDQLEADGELVGTRSRVTGLVGGLIAATLDGDVPIESQYHLGGLGRLSGLQEDERTGPHAALVRGMAYRRVRKLLPIVAGVSAEFGSTFESRTDIGFSTAVLSGALFAAIETPFGPLSVALGLAEGGRQNFYLTVGQRIGSRRPAFRPR